MRALLVINFQKGFLQIGDFSLEKERVLHFIRYFRDKEQPIIFMCHEDEHNHET